MMMSRIVRLKNFMVYLGTAARNLPQIEEQESHEREIVKEFFEPAIEEEIKAEKKEARKEKRVHETKHAKPHRGDQIKELKETILRIEQMFKKIEKEAGNHETAHKIKFKLDLLHHRLMVLEKKK